jgi:uncharacterized membrane protein
MDERAMNSAEWENASNWTGPRWLSIYHSPRDTRLWVPKQIPAFGWTINFRHRRARLCVALVLVGVALFVVLSNLLVATVKS